MTLVVHFTHGSDGLFDERVLIFLQTDDAAKMVEHGPLVLTDDIVIESSDQRRLIGRGVAHVVAAVFTVVVKGPINFAGHGSSAFGGI